MQEAGREVSLFFVAVLFAAKERRGFCGGTVRPRCRFFYK
jgi:hypothetical protein